MSARASRKETPRPELVEGWGWRLGRIELQAIENSQPARIAVIRCESVEEAQAAGEQLLTKGLDLRMLCIVFGGDRRGPHTIDLLEAP